MMQGPQSRGRSAPVASTTTGSGLPENVAGALTYLVGPITGIAFYVIDRDRAFVRFHAVQCIATTIVGFAAAIALSILGAVLGFIPILGWLVGLLLSLAFSVGMFGLWLLLMYQAYQGERWEVPMVGSHARRIAAGSEEGEGGSQGSE